MPLSKEDDQIQDTATTFISGILFFHKFSHLAVPWAVQIPSEQYSAVQLAQNSTVLLRAVPLWCLFKRSRFYGNFSSCELKKGKWLGKHEYFFPK